jgi:hypothetical protein
MINENSDPKPTPPELTVIPTAYSSDCYLSYFAMMLLISKPKPTP